MTATQPNSRSGPAVLVIDDEDYVAEMIASALQQDGYTVQIAYNGRQGLDLVLKQPFDLIIIDIMMPYLNGLALAAQVRAQEHLANVPIILISAGVRPDPLLPQVTFLPKPFDLQQMLAHVRARIAGGPACDELRRPGDT